MQALTQCRNWLSRYTSDVSGVAAVEFAFVVPIMLLLYLGSYEGSTIIIIDRKVQTAASALGDLVSRANGALPTSVLVDYFNAVSGSLHPYSSSGVVQTITGVKVETDGTATVQWSKQHAESKISAASPYTLGSTMSLPQEMIDLAKGQVVIVAEASYEYAPSFAVVINQEIELHHTSYHMPRTSKGVSVSP